MKLFFRSVTVKPRTDPRGLDGAEVAQPAEFLIDSNGKIPWVNLTGS